MHAVARLAALTAGCLAVQVGYAGDADPEAQQEAQALIGVEYQFSAESGLRQTIAGRPSCSNIGGTLVWIEGKPFDDWSAGELECKDRRILALKRQLDSPQGALKWKIVDTQLLPAYDSGSDDKRPAALRLHSTGECTLDGKTDTLFFVLLRWGKRERVDWRTGIERAWGLNLKAERIVPLSTRRIVCEKPDPHD